MNSLSETESGLLLKKLNHGIQDQWKISGDKIKKDIIFEDFVTAFKFMSLVAEEAEKLNHHPDWCNSYNRVSIELTTHSAGVLTELDFRLAEKIESIASSDIG